MVQVLENLEHPVAQTVSQDIIGYLIPRTTAVPLVPTVVLVGPTGSGKSTLFNSLLGEAISETGVLRPTTNRVTLLHHPQNNCAVPELETNFPLTTMTREVSLLQSLTLVDAPDLDSTATNHREWAKKMVDGAELMVWVTTPTRYGDATPWEFLLEQKIKGREVMVVINRITRRESGASAADLKRITQRRGIRLSHPPLEINEQRLAPSTGLLPPLAVWQLEKKLQEKADPSEQLLTQVWADTQQQVADGLLKLQLIYPGLRSEPLFRGFLAQHRENREEAV